MNTSSIIRLAGVSGLALAATAFTVPQPAAADQASTAAIVAGAAAIVGGLLYDSNNRPYYQRSGHRVYVSQRVAQEYRGRGGRYRDNRGGWHGQNYNGGNHGGQNHNSGDHGGNQHGH